MVVEKPAQTDHWDRLRILICDHLNLARGKYIPANTPCESIRICAGIYALGYDRTLTPAPGSGVLDGLPDIVLTFDKDNIQTGWEPNVGVVVADLKTADNKVMPLCGRNALKRAIKQWDSVGLKPKIGIELEAFLLKPTENATWVPYDTPSAYVYSTGPTADPAGITELIWRQAKICGFNIQATHSEYDWPQFEFTLACNDALRAIDEVFLFRLMASEICAQTGYKLSFMPKPLSDRCGSGFHINFSLVNHDAENAFTDSSTKDHLSALGKHCIAGLLKHHASLAGLVAPTINSYRRLRPGNLSGYWANWGYDHRGAAVRIPSERNKNTRIEYRLPDSATNPYIATAAMLQAAFLGYQQKYSLPAAETGDDLAPLSTRKSVPDTLGQALDALAADTTISQAIGKEIIDHFLAIKRAEWHRYLSHTSDWELNEYIHFL